MVYNVSFEKNGVPQCSLAQSKNKKDVEKWFKKNKPTASIYSIDIAEQDDMKPGKACIKIS